MVGWFSCVVSCSSCMTSVNLSSSQTLLAVKAEKQHQEFTSGIEHFSKDQLQHTQVTEKNPLPDCDGTNLNSIIRCYTCAAYCMLVIAVTCWLRFELILLFLDMGICIAFLSLWQTALVNTELANRVYNLLPCSYWDHWFHWWFCYEQLLDACFKASVSNRCSYFIAIAAEKKEVELREGIESFNKENLKHADTQVKDVLPDKQSK